MSGVLVVNDEVREAITKAVARARERPTPWVPEVADATPTDTLTFAIAAARASADVAAKISLATSGWIGSTSHAAFSFEFGNLADYFGICLYRHALPARCRGRR